MHAAAIIALTSSGFTARMIARSKPHAPLYALTANPHTQRILAVVWGVQPILTKKYATIDEAVASAETLVESLRVIKKGDRVIISAGLPIG